jgi:hypothetical protein
MSVAQGKPAWLEAISGGEGLDSFLSIDVDESEEAVKASPGKLYGWYLYNLSAGVRYVKIYDGLAADVVVGTTTPKLVLPLPAGGGANQILPLGIDFETGITVAATTGIAHNDTGAPGANEVVVNLLFK